MIRAIPQPLVSPLVTSLISSDLDIDARAYISAVTSAGATVTATQRAAINSFIGAEKTANRWALHRRIYLPIWGVAAANAIDMVGRTSGTWVGGVTHGAGWAQGDGSTGFLNFGVTPASLGLTTASATATVLIYQAGTVTGTRAHMMAGNLTAAFGLASPLGTTLRSANASYTTADGFVESTLATTSQNGILTGGRAGGVRYVARRLSSGASVLASETDGNAGTMPAFNLYGMAWNVNGTTANWIDARYGAFAVGLGLAPGDNDFFTANLKTLWETCTGLTLP